MSRFNAAPKLGTRSPVSTHSTGTALQGQAYTALGAPGRARDARSELFLLAVSSMVSVKGNHHEAGAARDARMIDLVRQVATDTAWVTGFVRFLREQANLRTVSLMIAAQVVHARLEAGVQGNRGIISAALQRPDEPGEMLAYWTSTFGRNVPKPVKRGVGDAVLRLYNERAVIKYNTASKGYRFNDVLQITHPTTDSPWQSDLFRLLAGYDVDMGEHGPLPTLRAHRDLMAIPHELRHTVTTGQLKEAGMTWESYSAYLNGPMDAKAWQTVIPTMGYTALLRNLRNFDAVGIDRISTRLVEDRLIDPAQVARSRQLPLRFLSAYRATRDARVVTGWGPVLEQALNLSMANVPELPGRTLVMVDLSGSMYSSSLSDNSDLLYVDAATVFGAAVALRAQSADLYGFGSVVRRFEFRKGDSVLPLAERMVKTTVDETVAGYRIRQQGLGGTETAWALDQVRPRTNQPRYDRVVIVTDEQYGQTGYGWANRGFGRTVDQVLDEYDVPVYTWNLTGYKVGQGRSGDRRRHVFGGLSDAAFRMIPLLEVGQSQDWAALFAPVTEPAD